MTAKGSKSSFFFLAIFTATALFSCEKQKTATAIIYVVEEYTATQGTVHRTRPIEAAEVRVYANPPSEVDEILFTDGQGMVEFTYEYEAILIGDVSFEGRESIRNPIRFELGKTTTKTIVLPQ